MQTHSQKYEWACGDKNSEPCNKVTSSKGIKSANEGTALNLQQLFEPAIFTSYAACAVKVSARNGLHQLHSKQCLR